MAYANDHAAKPRKPNDTPGFDPDSPDVSDPQMDPRHPAKPPRADVEQQRAPGKEYPPYSKP